MLYVLINPSAGSGLASRAGKEVAQWLSQRGTACKIFYTKGAQHATELAQNAALQNAETVLVVGGDGTVCEAARGLLGTDTALGIIPSGTGNDMARLLKVPKNPIEAVKFALSHPPHAIDAGKVNDALFINVCGTGFDVCVLEHSIAAKKYMRGMLPYLWGVLCALFTFRPLDVTFEVDGGEIQNKSLMILAVANGRFLGGGINVAPSASPNDGLLDLITVDALPRYKIPFQLPKLLTGRIMKIPGAQHVLCKNVSVRKPLRLNLDGELEQKSTSNFSVVPNALYVHYSPRA